MSYIADGFLRILKSHIYLSFPIFLISMLNIFIFMFLFKILGN
jgi:hypothetical protein